jgi:hypothetical protein
MTDTDYLKYVVRKPTYEHTEYGTEKVKTVNRQSPPMTFISDRQIPGVNYCVELGWTRGIPEPNPDVYEHVHEFDQIMLYWGGDIDTPQDLGGEIEFYIGGQPIVFNTTTAMFIPKGTPHGPVTWRQFRFPHVEMTITIGTGDVVIARGSNSLTVTGKGQPRKTDNFDYEQYVVRSPMREAGLGVYQKGRQAPTMTYMSSTQVNKAKCYIEFGWIWGEVEPSIPEMRHNKYDEIVLHIGNDPDNPEDLGANLEMGLDGHLMSFDTSCALFVPKGLRHGPNNFRDVKKPYIEMAIMLGAGTWAEGWADSFFERPPAKQK